MKFVAISDTHGEHKRILVPDADVVVHAGDLTRKGTLPEVLTFLKWYVTLPHKYKIFIAGNHDFFFEKATPQEVNEILPEGIIYLNDSYVTIEGIKIWGSPIQPWYHDWAFNRHRGEQINMHWSLIHDDCDIIVTHGPVANVLDLTWMHQHVGCVDLQARVAHIKPAYHICGHIHESYGMITLDGITYINASVLDLKYKPVHEPILFDYKKLS